MLSVSVGQVHECLCGRFAQHVCSGAGTARAAGRVGTPAAGCYCLTHVLELLVHELVFILSGEFRGAHIECLCSAHIWA